MSYVGPRLGIGWGIGTQAMAAYEEMGLEEDLGLEQELGSIAEYWPIPPPPPTPAIPPKLVARRRGVQAQLGACCSSCAKPGRAALGALPQLQIAPKAGVVTGAPGSRFPIPPSSSTGSTVVKLALLAGVGVGGFLLIKKLRAKKAA